MRKLVSVFIRFPFYANIIIVFLLIGGVFSLLNMKKSFFPEFESKVITISIFYPGASPKEMEEGLTARIEESIRSIVGIKETNSTSSENFAIVTITTTGEYDIDETLTEVKNAVDAISSFPADAEKPVIFKRRSISQAMYLGLSGDVDLLTLKNLASEIEDDFLNSGVISQLSINGYPDLEISVEITEDNLLRYKLTFDEISRAIAANNRDISAGMIKSDEEEVLIRSRSRSVDPEEIGGIILRANNDGSYLRIRDVASVKMQFADVSRSLYLNGKRNVSFSVNKLPEEDLDAISKFCNDYVKEFNETHQGVKLTVTYDFLVMLKGRLNLLYKNGGIGLLLVLISLGLFLSFRLSAWVAWGIPASFLGMFVIASIYGITINMISLFGMILVIGILVDDGIVIAENIYTHFEKGKSPRLAALDGTMEVLPAVMTSVTTTIIAFSPLFFISGRMEFMFEMAFVVVFSLLISLFEAFFVLPAHVGNKFVLRRTHKDNTGTRIRKFLEKVLNYFKNKVYSATLKFMIKWRWVAVAVPLALIIITAGLFGGGLIKSTFFPSIPFDQFNVDISFKAGSGEMITLEHLKRIDDMIWEVDKDLKEELNDTNSFVNFTFVSTGSAFNGQESGAHAGNIFVLLRDLEGAGVSSYEIVQKVRDKIGEFPEAEKFTIAGRHTFGTPVSVSLLGKDLDELGEAKLLLMKEMRTIEVLNNINDNNSAGKREIKLELKPKAYFLGLDNASIASQVRQGFFGGQAQRLQKGKDEIRVWVRYPKHDRVNIGQLESMKIKTVLGEYPLSELATYTIERGPVDIKRFNGAREVRIDADLDDPFEPVPPIIEKIRTEIIPQILVKYPGIKVEYQGQQRDSDEAMDEIKKLFSLAFALMLLVIMIHFKSATQALIIIMMIPLAWMGATWGHGIEGVPVSMLSTWGMVALSGVIINDAVVFLQKYNTNLLEGQKVTEAAYNAGIARFRAIVLTTLTTVVGLYPIILEQSFQAQFLRPMAIALAYGVMFGTSFILILFPVLILVLNDIKVYLTWMWTGNKPVNETVENANKNSKGIIE
ncbi:MAG: efflux RND transporter permease subunit [Bacteroidales bacterium]|nr:efflux RND transporter permease subunit [Bacteroidales bacterium]